jgi:hypothetical protein
VLFTKKEQQKKNVSQKFKQALKETKEMADNIAAGKNNYKTLDELLNE